MELIQITNVANRYSENLLSPQSLISDNTTITYDYNTTSGGYILSEKDSFTGSSKALKASIYQNVISGFSVSFDLGDALKHTVEIDGNYIFQTNFKITEINANPGTLVDLNIKMFVNTILTETFTKVIDINSLELEKYYTVAQSFNLNEGDLVDFSFQLERPSIGTPNPNFTICFDGFKLENNTYNIGAVGVPSFYSLPVDVFLKSNSTTGWEQITDTTYTSGSPLSIVEGVTGKILTGTVSRITTQLPSGVTEFYNTTTDKLMAVNDGDAFTLSLRFKAKMDVANGLADVAINIGGALNVISQETLVFSKGIGVEQRFDIDLSYFTGTTFIANGGDIEITPLNGDISIYDIVLVPIRTHKGF